MFNFAYIVQILDFSDSFSSNPIDTLYSTTLEIVRMIHTYFNNINYDNIIVYY